MVIASLCKVPKMNLLRVKDNSQYNKESFSSVAALTTRICDKTLEQLEHEGVFVFPDLVSDSEGLSANQMVLQTVNDKYRTENVMGFLGLGDERIVIESRFSNNNGDYFLQYMLERVLGMPSVVNFETDANCENQLFNYLLFLFPRYLKAAMRKGPFKEYVRRSYNDGNVKGAIDVARHIEMNTPFVGKIAYTNRVFSFDNDLMELVRHTIEYIKAKPYGNKVLSTAKSEVMQVVEATEGYKLSDKMKILERSKKSPVRHAYYREYLALQRICILILRHQTHQIGSGTRQIYGILFDGAWLWEEYIASLIGESFHHPSNKLKRGGQRLFERGVGLIYPDFINRDSASRVIADAKYKPVSNIGNHDYLQVLAYMFRFDASEGFYLYPEADENDSLRLRMNSGSTYEGDVQPRHDVSVIKHGLRIPVIASNYDDFASRMKVSEQEFSDPLTSPLAVETS